MLAMVSVLLAAAAIALVICLEWVKRPRLTVGIADPTDREYPKPGGSSLKCRYVHVYVENGALPVPLRRLTQRRTAAACRALLTFRTPGQVRPLFEPVVGRWAGTPEPLQPRPDGGYVLDVTKLPAGQEKDVAPGGREIVDVAVKFDGESQFYVWNNESYVHDWRRPPPLDGREYHVLVSVRSGGVEVAREFRLRNNGSSRHDLYLEYASGR
jgi:hypothetical protein